MKEQIQKIIAEALFELGLKPEQIHIENPTDLSMGDFSSNVALAKAKELNVLPKELAEKIKTAVEGKIDHIEKIEVAGPGFINFYASKKYFDEEVQYILSKGSDYGKNVRLAGKRVMFEYTDPNPFKQFHIGHLMSNAIGESLSRLYEWSGSEVKRANYQGDVGLHVAKAMWGIMKRKSEMPSETADLTVKAAFIGDAYSYGSGKYDEDGDIKKEIDDLNAKIFLREDEEIIALYNWGRKISLDHFEEVYAKLGTKFDFYFFEDEVANRGIEIVNENLTKGVFEKSDGAVVFRGDNHGLHTRVFINSKGLPTYEAKELGLAERKAKEYLFDNSITITANEQSDYFKVVMKALELIDPLLRSKMTHIAHGMLRFAQGKMSSRKGNIITGESLIAAMENLVLEKMSDRELSQEEKREVAEQVGVAAIKFSILKQSPGKDIIYDFDKSLSFEGDSGPYLQYATVRAKSVLEKAREEGIGKEISETDDSASVLTRLLPRFSEEVERAQMEFAPNYIVTYLLELSSAYNSYYAQNKIVDAADPKSPFRVALTRAFVQTMENGLHLLGIKVPRKM